MTKAGKPNHFTQKPNELAGLINDFCLESTFSLINQPSCGIYERQGICYASYTARYFREPIKMPRLMNSVQICIMGQVSIEAQIWASSHNFFKPLLVLLRTVSFSHHRKIISLWGFFFNFFSHQLVY